MKEVLMKSSFFTYVCITSIFIAFILAGSQISIILTEHFHEKWGIVGYFFTGFNFFAYYQAIEAESKLEKQKERER